MTGDTGRVKHPFLASGAVLGLVASLLVAAPAGAAVSTDPPPESATASPVSVTNDIVYTTVDGEPIMLDAYVPNAKTTKRPVIMLVHGGSWRGGDKSNFIAEGMKLAALGYVAFSVNYRLTPEHPYPAAVDDVEAAVRWVRQPPQVKTYAINPKRVGAVGASAGGHLVGMLATLGSGSLTKGARIKAAVSWSGPMDFKLWPLPQLTLVAHRRSSAVVPQLPTRGSDVRQCRSCVSHHARGQDRRADAPRELRRRTRRDSITRRPWTRR